MSTICLLVYDFFFLANGLNLYAGSETFVIKTRQTLRKFCDRQQYAIAHSGIC